MERTNRKKEYSPHHSSLAPTDGGYVIGNSQFRNDIECALRQRATPRSPGRQTGGLRL